MKKRIVIAISIILTMALGLVGLVGCEKKQDNYKIVMDSVSYIQKDIYSGATDNYKVRLLRGDKEKDFIADGKKTNVSPFMQILVIPKNLDMLNKVYSYKLVGESGEATGSLVKNTLGASFGASVSGGGVSLGALKNISITVDNKAEVIALDTMTKDCISAEKALEYAYKALEDKLVGGIVKGEFDREVYVKYINDRNNSDSVYYWYVSFMKNTSDYISVLINPKDGSVMSIKK